MKAFARRNKQPVRFTVLAVFIVAFWGAAAHSTTVSPSDAVTTHVVVRALPSTNSAKLGTLAPGDQAEELESVPNWLKVQLFNGTIGYVSKRWVVEVEGPSPTPSPTPTAGGTSPSPTVTPSPTATPSLTSSPSVSATPTATQPASQKGRHCDDPPPANPANCTLGIDQPFSVGCNPPFADAQSHDIDLHCPNEGCAKNDNDKAQNKVKNNLCASGTSIQINTTSIDMLQADVDQLVQQGTFKYGGSAPQPADRAKLQGLSTLDANGASVTLGEGMLVTLEGFVLDAKHDDTYVLGSGLEGFQGEGVNCKNSLFDWNDIHISLGETASAEECSSVTAEIIPHFRPAVWDRFDSNSCTSPHVTNALPVKGLRVRITGQLFFDGSHSPAPCVGPAGPNSFPRRAVWEIHPVYAIEVFDTAKNKFVTLEEWAQGK